MPPSPPSDQLPNTNRNVNDDNASVDSESDSLTVSSTPSLLLDDSKTTTRINLTKRDPVTVGHDISCQYKSRNKIVSHPPNEDDEQSPDKRQKFQVQSRNSIPRKSQHRTFGSNSDVAIADPDQIRIALGRYEQQKGQNLHELF